ncbi:MAG: glycerol-3-phosphate acyltransferase [Actinomyces sp.]|nr:MAG: glycerol-3-phosphate acyltransferase [Actinomyces sp.]
MSGLVVTGGLIVGGYLLGTVPTALVVGRRLGHDPTAEGSGNPGASNVYRLAGRRAGLVVALVDLAKGAVPAAVASLVVGRPGADWVWLAAVAGHVWPVTRRFRGGKGVATAGGGGLVLAPVAGVVCLALFAAAVATTRIAAVGSLAMAVAYPLLLATLGRPGDEVAVAVVVAAVLVIRHRSNLARLVRGEERRLGGRGPR